MLRLLLNLMAVVAFVFPAAAQDRAQIGTLGCETPGIFGNVRPPIIVKRPITVDCTFVSSGRAQQLYQARINFQIPLSPPLKNHGGLLKWIVFALVPLEPAVLSGGYSTGLEADPIAKGLGKELLVGGVENLVILQPSDLPDSLITRIETMELEFLRCQPEGDTC